MELHVFVYLLLRSHLLDVTEDVQHVPNAPRRLLNLGRQTNAAHRDRLHVVPNEGLGVEEALEKYLSRCHSDLKCNEYFSLIDFVIAALGSSRHASKGLGIKN